MSSLQGVVFTLSGIQNPLRQDLRELAVNEGAEYRAELDDEVTHVVSAFPNTPKVQEAKILGNIHIVSPRWIIQSVEEEKHLAEESFSIAESRSAMMSSQASTSSGGHRARSRSPVRKNSQVNKMSVCDKIERSRPFCVFFSVARSIPETQQETLSLTFSDILDISLGEVVESLQFNYMVDEDWLHQQYEKKGVGRTPVTVVHCKSMPVPSRGRRSHFSYVTVDTGNMFHKHHTKMSILLYRDDSLRVVVHTGNLIERDWENKTQGMWIGPRCPRLNHHTAGESPTNFRRDVGRYLSAYRRKELQPWVDRINQSDCSMVRVYFVSSVKGSYSAPVSGSGLLMMKNLLQKHSSPHPGWPVIAQISSIGSLGPDSSSWLEGAFMSHLCPGEPVGSKNSVNVIYPSQQTVIDCVEGPMLGGDCLPYNEKTHQKQKWLEKKLCHWYSSSRHRTGAMPHIKTFCRVSPDGQELLWLLLKVAWGQTLKKDGSFAVNAYEAGVLLLPKSFDKVNFGICTSGEPQQDSLPLPYDLPLQPYRNGEKPWAL